MTAAHVCAQLPRTAQPAAAPPPAGATTASAAAPATAAGTHALAYSVTGLMAAELKRLLAERRQRRKAELEAQLASERKALAQRNSFDLSVRRNQDPAQTRWLANLCAA